ncbi:hypothetical protein O7621_16455 [Solwaraspora sp. WMMD937]|uniref:hypothetical protein n=1 Tax=Solwaraspora sp. WMMD937 TaxID=3016090 RepID=UPI002499CD40|nr:hypothetical protein [Solwaraspora sp. WMMD937]WFE19530.1 hypothetical protein O7621_16455 [Solwaraspora sp. WMMD937]
MRMHSMTTHTWAPEAFRDAGRDQYGIVYSARSGNRDSFFVNYTSRVVNGGPYTWRSGNVGSNSWSAPNKAQYIQPLNAEHLTIAPITARIRPIC